MTPSKRTKKAGLKSLKEYAELSGRNVKYLHNQYHKNKLAFDMGLYAAVLKRAFEALNER